MKSTPRGLTGLFGLVALLALAGCECCNWGRCSDCVSGSPAMPTARPVSTTVPGPATVPGNNPPALATSQSNSGYTTRVTTPMPANPAMQPAAVGMGGQPVPVGQITQTGGTAPMPVQVELPPPTPASFPESQSGTNGNEASSQESGLIPGPPVAPGSAPVFPPGQ